MQALVQLIVIFPSVPPSAIAAALGTAGGNVEQAADLLFKAAQARPACTVGTRRASPRQPTEVVGRQCAVGSSMNTHGRTRDNVLTRAVVPSIAACGGLHHSVAHPTCRTQAAEARCRRVTHRAPALRPHRTAKVSRRIRRAHNREGHFSTLSDPPNLGPRRALQLCHYSFCSGRPRRRRPKRRRRSAPTLDVLRLHRSASDAPSLRRFAIAVACTHAVQAEKAEAEKIQKAEAEKANALQVAVRHATGWHGTKGV